MANEKVYVPKSYGKTRTTQFGDIYNLDFHAETLIEFVKANTDARGYFKISVSKQKTPKLRDDGTIMSDLTIALNNWKPENAGEAPKAAPAKGKTAAPAKAAKPPVDDEETPPF